MKALKQNDQDIKNLITEQASVGTSDENLLVVLTTDHGGKGSGHGKFSDEEITT
jgi:predicted AlkP superfamily pyrophosphatase or phosphodiesterase